MPPYLIFTFLSKINENLLAQTVTEYVSYGVKVRTTCINYALSEKNIYRKKISTHKIYNLER